MATQSPTISIPKKATEEVDWTTPIHNLIAQSYGENPENYAGECAALQRCRQDAVRGAGSDMTARDLLYKYFGQLELLELRFAEIRVTFPWHDAFTNKLTTQTSVAFEKASIIFQIAATHSAIATSQNRGDPEGLKRAFHYFRTSAGMLMYINENFLHAPSTDLSREVIKFLVSVMLAQATEAFYEKCVEERKASGLIAKVANQTAFLYTGLSEEVKEFMGKGIFDRNWVTILQIKSKYFFSLAQYHRAMADETSGKHGDTLARLILAEPAAKEASRTAASFAGLFMPQMSPNLPPDAGSAIQELTKFHLARVTEKKNESQRDNDLIYNAIVPSSDTLPHIDKLVVANIIPIQDVYGTPEVQKIIGHDLFIKLIPLSVHESASVYSEEKAKLVRAEVERAEVAEGEVRAALDSLGIKEGLGRYKAMVESLHPGSFELPSEVARMRDDIGLVEEREPVSQLLTGLERLRNNVHEDIDSAQRDLDTETRDCEAMRVKYEHNFTQPPSAGPSRALRQDIKSHSSALEAASVSDQQVLTLWERVKADISLLLSDQIEDIFRQSAEHGPSGDLLDLDFSTETKDDEERNKIAHSVDEIENRLGRLNKISVERKNVLKDLKEKIQADDVSHLLLLNRRNQAVEPTLFSVELEKFKPYQSRLAATVQYEQGALQEITQLWKGLRDLANRGSGARKWEEREKRLKESTRRFSRTRDDYMEVRDGIAKGLQFYRDLLELCTTLRQNVKSFVIERAEERGSIVEKAESERKQQAAIQASRSSLDKPLSLSSVTDSLGSSLASMSLRSVPPPPAPPPRPSVLAQNPSYSSLPPLPPPSNYGSPVPPPPQTIDPYANMFGVPGLPHHFATNGAKVPSSFGQDASRNPAQYRSFSSPPPQPPPLPRSLQLPPNQQTQNAPYGYRPSATSPFPPPLPPANHQATQHASMITSLPGRTLSFPPPPDAPSTGQSPYYGQHQQSPYGGYPR